MTVELGLCDQLLTFTLSQLPLLVCERIGLAQRISKSLISETLSSNAVYMEARFRQQIQAELLELKCGWVSKAVLA